MKKLLSLLILLVVGTGLGGGAGYGAILLLGPSNAAATAPDKAEHAGNAGHGPSFVPAGEVLAPVVAADGHLSGYVKFDLQLEVGADKAEFVAARLPLMLHAINMRTFRTPMASGPDGMLPNLDTFRRVAQASADEAFGAGVVRRVAIVQATPA